MVLLKPCIEGRYWGLYHYIRENGKTPTEEEYFKIINHSDRKRAIRFLATLTWITERPKLSDLRNHTKVRYEGNDIWVIKGYQDRFYCFFDDGKIIMVVYDQKKQDKADKNKLKQAEVLREEYYSRKLDT